MREFEIKNELLQQAIWGGYLCKNGALKNSCGYFNTDTDNYGRGFLEFCYSKIFDIHRVPGFEQYYIQDATNMKLKKEYGELHEKDILDACKELEAYYTFLQRELKDCPYVKDGKIELVRSLRDYERIHVIPQLEEQKDLIELPVNIINSYAHDKRLYGYYSTISIVRTVEIEKVVMYFDSLKASENVCWNNLHGNEYEVWVLEDDMFGKILLPNECFKYKELEKINRRHDYLHIGNLRHSSSLFAESIYECKPCEWNEFTRRLIERNKKKIVEQEEKKRRN